jgi:hypothetical protein
MRYTRGTRVCDWACVALDSLALTLAVLQGVRTAAHLALLC